MSTSVGDLTIDVSTNTASVEIGFSRLADIVGQRTREIEKSVGGIKDRMDALSGAFRHLAEITVAGIGVHAFADMISGAIEAQAHLEDLGTKIGTTASELSKLIPAAKLSGTSLDDIASVSAKFEKTLLEVETGTGKAARAFQALHLTTEDAKRFLDNPTQGLFEFAKATQQFANDGNLAAIRMELMGKNAQALAPFLKQLAEQTTLVSRVSDDAALRAKALTDHWATLQLRSDDLKNTIATALVPAFERLLSVWDDLSSKPGGVRDEIQKLASDGTLAIWAVQTARALAIVAETFVVLGQALYAFVGSIKVVANDINVAALIADASTGNLVAAAQLKGALEERNKDLAEANSRWSALWDDNHTALSSALTREIDDLDAFRTAAQKRVIEAQNAVRDAAANQGERFLRGSALAGAYKPSVSTAGVADAKEDPTTQRLDALVQAMQKAALAQEHLGKVEEVYLVLSEKKLQVLNAEQQLRARLAVYYAKVADDIAAANKELSDSARLYETTLKLQAQFGQQITEATRGIAQSAAKVQTESLAQVEQDIERQYGRGLIDFQQYWDARTAIQRAALAVQEKLLVDDIGVQERQVESLQAQLRDLGENQAKFVDKKTGAFDETKFLEAVYDLYGKLIPASAKLTESQATLNVTQQKGAAIGRDYVEQLIAQSNGFLESNRSLDQQIERRAFENEAIGKTTDQVYLLRIARVEEMRANAVLASAGDDVLAFYDAQIVRLQALRGLAGVGEDLQKQTEGWRQLFTDVADIGTRFLDDFVHHTSSAFHNLWENFKTWALQAFAKIASQTVVLNLVSAVAPGLAGAAAGALPSALGSAATGASGSLAGGLLSGLGDSLFGGGGAAAFGEGFFSPFATATELLTGGFEAFASPALALATTLGAAIPILGAVVIAATLIAHALDKGPAERTASFGTGSGLGAGNPLFQSSSAFGAFGVFNDQWFSNADQGDAIQKFLTGLKSIDNAISALVGKDVTAHIADVLANVTTTFSAGVEHQATEFGAVMQQRYSAVAHAIDNELGDLVDNFTGTGDALGKFVTSIVAVYEALSKVDTTALFGQNVSTGDIVALTETGGDVAATFKHLVDVFTLTNAMVQLFSGNINETFGAIGLASADAREHLIDLLGGIQAAGEKFSAFAQTMLTDSQRNQWAVNNASEKLTDGFARLGLAIPATHQAFVDLVNATLALGPASAETYAALIDLSGAFVTVNGTAQDAANATAEFNRQMDEFAKTVHDAMRGLMTDAQRMQDDWDQIGAFWTVHGAEIFQLTNGAFTSLPTTNSGMLTLLATLSQMGPAGLTLANQIVQFVIPSVNDLNNSLAKLPQTINSIDVGSLIKTGQTMADTIIAGIDSIVSSGDIGQKLASRVNLIGHQITQLEDQITNAPWYVDTRPLEVADTKLHQAYDKAAATYARYTTLVAQFGPDIGGQLEQLSETYDQQKLALGNNAALLADAATAFGQRWNDIVNGTKKGVTDTTDQLAKLRAGILDYANKLQQSDLSILSPLEKLAKAQAVYDDIVKKASAGDLDALGKFTQVANDFLTLDRQVNASNSTYSSDFKRVLGDSTRLGTGLSTTTDVTAALAAAVPTDSKLFSQKDGQALQAEIADTRDTLAAILAALHGTAQDTADSTKATARAVQDATNTRR
jgi:hypothetical protein